MKKIISSLLSLLMISSSLISVQVTLINNEIVSGSFIKHEYEEIYLSKDKELYIIGDDVIQNINYDLGEKNQLNDKINYNSYREIHKIYKKVIYAYEPDFYLDIKSFSINDKTIPFKYYKMMKIEFINGDIFVGKFLGETDKEIKLFTQTEKSFIKQDIQHIWLLTESEKTGRTTGGIIGGLVGVFMGGAAAGFLSLGDDTNDKKVFLVFSLISTIGIATGYLLGSVTGSLFEKEKLVWSKN